MRLIARKKRPLKRDQSQFRDDRLFLIACDDKYAPKQYFDFFELPRVKTFVIATEDDTSHASQVLNRLKSYDYEVDDERWMLLDTDHCLDKSHIRAYKRALKEAKQKGINVAISRSCFEVWLLLHHLDEVSVARLGNASEVETALRATISQYNKTKLKQEHYPLSKVVIACQRAETLDKEAGGEVIPKSTTSRVYLLWKALAEKSLRSQLPPELWPLIKE